jgi:hypothetical protein
MNMNRIYAEANYEIIAVNDSITIKSAKGEKTIANPQIGNSFPPAVAAALAKQGAKTSEFFPLNGYPVRIAAHPAVAEAIEKMNAAIDRQASEIEAAIPGLAELRAAHAAWEKYQRDFSRMMSDEQNDGLNAPAPVANPQEIAAKYPMAATYYKAENYALANNDRKAGAGRAAMTILQNGGSIEEAESIMATWLPMSAYTD